MSNTRNKISIEFDFGDLPAMAHALMIERNVAALNSNREAKQRLDRLAKRLFDLCPPVAHFFDHQVWCELAATLADAESFEAGFKPGRYSWDKPTTVYVKIGDRVFTSENQFNGAVPDLDALKDLLAEMSSPRTDEDAPPSL